MMKKTRSTAGDLSDWPYSVRDLSTPICHADHNQYGLDVTLVHLKRLSIEQLIPVFSIIGLLHEGST